MLTGKTINEITTTTNQPEGLCKPNPCENNGICRLSYNKDFYSCFCKTNYTGEIIFFFML
jgi:hypothetical protein